jgi:hypothetical protein
MIRILVPATEKDSCIRSFPKYRIRERRTALKGDVYCSEGCLRLIYCLHLEDQTLQPSFSVKWIMLASEDQINLLLIKCIAILFLHSEVVMFFSEVSGIYNLA